MENESIASVGEAAPIAAETSQVSEAPVSSNEAPVERSTRREALDRAFAALDKPDAPQEAAKAPDSDAKPKGERVRNPDGTFAPLTADKSATITPPDGQQVEVAPVEPVQPVEDAPSRFSPDAKAAWKDAPPAIRGEIKRAISELEGGLQQKNEKLQQFAGLDQYVPLVQQGGKTIAQVFENYVGFERMVRQNPVQGTMHLLSNLGLSANEVAAAILGQEPSQQAAQSDRTIYELRQQLQQLQQQVGTVAQTFEQQQAAEAMRMIEQFKANKPRFDELRTDMQFFMEHGKASTLDEAYALAEKLNPLPQVTPQPAPAPVQAVPAIPAAQTRKAALSVTGSPAAGSNPTLRKDPSSRRGALDNAFASVGLA
jgi:DNA-binding transcriptional MerR regulator